MSYMGQKCPWTKIPPRTSLWQLSTWESLPTKRHESDASIKQKQKSVTKLPKSAHKVERRSQSEMISLKGLRGAVPNLLYYSKTPFKRMAAVRRVLFWYGGQFEGVWKEGRVGCQRCQVGRPMPYASKETQTNICRVRRTMIMSEINLRIFEVLYHCCFGCSWGFEDLHWKIELEISAFFPFL